MVDSSMKDSLRRLWMRLPAMLRGSVVAVAILCVGQLPPGVFVVAGLRFSPAVPWFAVATVVWLRLFWMVLDGRWWPTSTAERRIENLRGAVPRPQVWLWSLLAGGLGMVSVLSLAMLTGLVADLPRKAYDAPLDLSAYPPWTVVAFFGSVALTAGVVEEAAFRGYMLSIVQRRHGWWVAISSVAILFYLVHLSHVYATVAFVPFFMAYSALHGVLVYWTRSILPSVVLHAFGDFAVLPIQYGVVANPLGSSIGLHVLSVAGFGLASVLTFTRLAKIARCARAEAATLGGVQCTPGQ